MARNDYVSALSSLVTDSKRISEELNQFRQRARILMTQLAETAPETKPVQRRTRKPSPSGVTSTKTPESPRLSRPGVTVSTTKKGMILLQWDAKPSRETLNQLKSFKYGENQYGGRQCFRWSKRLNGWYCAPSSLEQAGVTVDQVLDRVA